LFHASSSDFPQVCLCSDMHPQPIIPCAPSRMVSTALALRPCLFLHFRVVRTSPPQLLSYFYILGEVPAWLNFMPHTIVALHNKPYMTLQFKTSQVEDHLFNYDFLKPYR
jgi:hypothetical protein